MVRDQNENYNVYTIDTNEKLNKYKVLIIILIVLLIIILTIIAKNSIESINQYKVYKQYEAQLASIQKQEEDQKAKIEAQKEKIRQEKMINLTDQGRKNIKNIYNADIKRAFLTFDDGPSSVTPTILDILKQENIKATFFVLGSRVDSSPDLVKRIYSEGHYVANHGYSHVYSSIYSSPQAVLDEFNKCNDSVKNAIGVPDYNSHLFRFPGGFIGGKYAEIKSQAKELLNENDIVHVDWNALVGDAETSTPTVEFELQRLDETVSGKNSVVILMHDAEAKKITAETLPQIISNLKERGYEFKNFYEIIK